MKLKIILEPSEEGGYTAIVPSLPGCISEGDTKAEALTEIIGEKADALCTYNKNKGYMNNSYQTEESI